MACAFLGSRARVQLRLPLGGVRLRLPLGGPCCLAVRSCWTSTRWAQMLKTLRDSPGKMHFLSPSPGSWGGLPAEFLPSSDGRKLSLCLMSTRGQTCVRLQISHPACLLALRFLLFNGSREDGVSSGTYHVTPSSHSSLDIRVLSPPTGLLGVTPIPVGRRYRQ